MKKLLILPGLLLLSAILPCGETQCADSKDGIKKPMRMRERIHKAERQKGKWQQWRQKGTELDITGANHKGVKCFYKEAHTSKRGEPRPATVFCKRIFQDVNMREGSPTGTPPHLMYENYIGSYIKEEGKPGVMGSGKRVILCDGQCVEKEKVEVKEEV